MLLLIFFLRSCSKSGQLSKKERENIRNTEIVDSLKLVLKEQENTINNISEVIRQEKIKVHSEYDNYISEKDRGDQLMELHKVVKLKIKELQK
jgi:Ni,Fe-hydrogenase III large subunit